MNCVLITGANKGIGFEIAKRLAKTGFTVYLGARDIGRGEAAAAQIPGARFIHLDLAQPQTIAAAATRIETEFQRLDVLVNNAAIADPKDGPPGTADPDAIRRIFETNFFGTISVTQAMLPLLRKSKAGRIVNLSSGLGSITLNADPAWAFAPYKLLGYSASKAALNMFTVQLAWELRDTAIKVNSADPGFTATDLNQHRGTQTLDQGAAESIRLALLPDDGPTGGFFETAGPRPW
jgi:NAD(P)-dependent dehydrogenase (short-subunit alcohol dehydrogenase family)